jgi:hypothetical protein
VLDFYAAFCAHPATCFKADGNDIKVLNLIFSGNSDEASETDPQKDLKLDRARIVTARVQLGAERRRNSQARDLTYGRKPARNYQRSSRNPRSSDALAFWRRGITAGAI